MRKQTFFRNIFTSHCCHCTERKKDFLFEFAFERRKKNLRPEKTNANFEN